MATVRSRKPFGSRSQPEPERGGRRPYRWNTYGGAVACAGETAARSSWAACRVSLSKREESFRDGFGSEIASSAPKILSYSTAFSKWQSGEPG